MTPPRASEDVKIPFQDTFYEPITEKCLEKGNAENGKRPRDSVLLYLSALAACLIAFGQGTVIVWTSPAIVRLKSNTEENPLGRPVSTIEISLISGLALFGSLLGPLFLSKLCDKIGRKKTMLSLSAIMLMSQIVLAFATTISLYYISRFLTGLCLGGAVVALSIFLSEITEDHNRGSIGCLIGLSYPLGNLYGYIIGPLVSIKMFTLLCTLPYIVQMIAFVTFVPESPVYFASKGDKTSAIRSLEKIRNKSSIGIEKEYIKIMHILKQSEESEVGVKTILTTRTYRKGFIIAVGLGLIQQLTGVAAILAFAAPLFDAANTSISGHAVGVLIGVIKLSSVFLATVIIERSGRRPLLIISTIGCGVSLFILGLFFYLKSTNSGFLTQIRWLPILAIILFFLFYGVGIGAIPAAITSELFPSNIRSTAVSLATVIALITCFGVTSSFPILTNVIGETFLLWAYSLCSFAGFVFVFLLVPEIKGKSLLEVQEILSR